MESKISGNNKSYSRCERGFTLIELMISSALGLIVVAGMYSLFTVNKGTIRMQSNIGAVYEQGHFALELIAEDLRMSGWPGVFDAAGTEPFGPRDDSYPLFKDSGNKYDTLVVSRRGRTVDPVNSDPLLAMNETDCVGNIIDFNIVNKPLTHIYFVNPVTRELMCESTLSGEAQPMVANVESFQVLYGVDMNSGPCTTPQPNISAKDAAAECMTPTVYVTANELDEALKTALQNLGPGAHSQLIPIKTVRLAIMIATEDDRIIDTELSRDRRYYLFERYIAHGIQDSQFDDGRIRRVFLKTVVLRQAFRGP
jgi:prepilin-type N-terminal cleavage/methylation domain-containing protein